MKEDKKIFDDRYSKKKTLGSGGEGVAYLVIEKDTGKKFVLKTIEQKNRKKEYEYEEDKEFEQNLEESKRMFNKISLIDSPYLIRCIREGKGEIKKYDEILKIRNYFIFEYAPKGNLFNIIKLGGSFEERYSKLIFKKILLGVQALHNKGIYHLDLKPENIVIDDNCNPKICDFGYATDKEGPLRDCKGTKNYLAPQKFKKKEYSGIKADIFSLGCILFILVLGGPCFVWAKKIDIFYIYIIERQKENFYEILTEKYKAIETLTNEFKDLVYRMIAYEENERPENIEKILEDSWFKDLTDEKEKELEKEIKAEFIEKEKKIKEQLKIKPTDSNYFFDLAELGCEASSSNKAVSKGKEYKYFKPNFNLEKKDIELDGDFYLKLLGNIDYCSYMNYLLNEIIKKYEEKKECCFITKIKENYKCNIEFQKEEEENEDGEDNEDNNKDLTIGLNLYRSGKEELVLRFLRKQGELFEYNEKVSEIISLAKELDKKKES